MSERADRVPQEAGSVPQGVGSGTQGMGPVPNAASCEASRHGERQCPAYDAQPLAHVAAIGELAHV